MSSTKIYDDRDYWLPLCADVESVRGSLVIYVPYITYKMLEKWLPMLRRAVLRGARVTVILQRPRDWDRRKLGTLPLDAQMRLNQFALLVEELQSHGIFVELRDLVHSKLLFIDEEIVWEGSLNFLSHNNTHEHLRRSVNHQEVKELKKRHSLDNLPNFAPQCDTDEALCKMLIARRQEIGLSAADLSREVAVSRPQISRFECGKSLLVSGLFRKVLSALDLRIVLVPAYLFGPVTALIAKLSAEHKQAVAKSATK